MKSPKSISSAIVLCGFVLALPGCSDLPTRTPLDGFVDLHTHPMINLALGGKLVHGGVDGESLLPTNMACLNGRRATSIADALSPDSPSHAPGIFDNPLFPNPLGFPCGDSLRAAIILGFQSGNNALVTIPSSPLSLTGGFPTFDQWPKWNDITHQKMWFEWIKRARDGRLRVMVALATNNKTLGDAVSGPLDLPTDDKASADLQLMEITRFVGQHPDLMEMAFGSEDIDRIARTNRIAVVLGVEIDNIGNFNQLPGPLTEPIISGEIQRLYNDGVRYIFPVHIMDNAFGGTAIYENSFNTANRRETGAFWTIECAKATDLITHKYVEDSNVLYGTLGLLKLGINPFEHPPLPPACQEPLGHRNANGLTQLGRFAIKEMMKRGMIIDIDHMSQRSADNTIAIAKGFGYPLVSGHSGIRGLPGATAENSRTPLQLRQISELGGMFGLGSDGVDAHEWAQLYQGAMFHMGYANSPIYNNGAVSFGTDLNGFVKAPRPGGRNNVVYNAAFPMSSSGTKSWDYNTEGVAHYGMLADFLEDVRTAPSNGLVNAQGAPLGVTGTELVDQHLFQSAERFYRMWWKIELLAGANTIN